MRIAFVGEGNTKGSTGAVAEGALVEIAHWAQTEVSKSTTGENSTDSKTSTETISPTGTSKRSRSPIVPHEDHVFLIVFVLVD